MSRAQIDLFDKAELFPKSPTVYAPDAERIRRRLKRIIGEAREAKSMPWDVATRRLYEQIVPQMSLALPEEEAAQFRLDFAREMERLG